MALPLLALGRAALSYSGRGAAGRGIAASTGRTAASTAKGAGAGAGAALGFGAIAGEASKQSPANNVVDFKTGRHPTAVAGSSMGGAAAPIVSNVNSQGVAGDIQAASELSMEELANQTKILTSIQKNTGKTAKNTTVPPSAGGQAAPPPTEEEIKAKLDGEDSDGKLKGILSNLAKSVLPLGDAMLALGAAVAAVELGNALNKPKTQTQADKKLLAATGQSEDLETNILGGTGTSKQIADYSIASTRFTTDEKGNRIVGGAEQEANKAKQEQIAGMIDTAGGSDQDYQLLETAFREGNVEDIQAIEDKYRKVGQEGSSAYQYRAAAESFSQADAVSVARDMGLEKPDLIGADQKTKDKFIADMLAKQQEFMEQYSTGIAGEGKNLDRRATLTGDKLFGSSRLDQVVESKFDAEGKGSFFGRSQEEGKAFDNIKAELEGYRKSLKSSGLGEKETNNRVSDELKKLEKLSAEQMMDYTAPKVSGDALQGAQTQASTAEADATARRATPPATAPSPATNKPAPETTNISTGIAVNNKAHDDTAKELKKLTGFQ
jgi:hypothetical protein